MKRIKKAVCALISLVLLIHPGLAGLVSAAQPEVQKPPERLRVEEIGNNLFDGYYLDFKWDYPDGFFVPGSLGTYLNFYQQEIPKPYKSVPTNRILADKDIRAESGITSHRLKNLKSGTIYYFDATAYYRYTEGTGTLTSDESAPSNRIKAMTGISLAAYAVGPNQIKIEWDDVWNSNGRINYRLYISDNPNFINTPARYISADDIGQGRAVQVNQSAGKLEYVHTVSQPGKVYYIKVVPEITDPELVYYPKESNVVSVASFILVRTTKVSSSSNGSIWRLDWTPVVMELGSGAEVKYEVYKGDITKSELPGRIQTVSNTSITVVVRPEEELTSYFIIRADVRKNGVPVYPGIKIESDKVMLRDQEVAAYPPAPQFVNQIGSISSEIGDTSARLLWKLPRKSDGSIDYDTSYDVWITTDPNLVDDPSRLGAPISWDLSKGASGGIRGSYTVNFDFVRSGTTVLGCQANISGLNPNTVYYFRIQARKSYLEYDEDGQLTYRPYSSDPAIKLIITLATGSISQPIVPPRPPFKVKQTPEGADMVTETMAVVQLKKKWYEKFNTETNRWEYVKTEKKSHDDTVDYDPSDPGTPPDGISYRLIEYDDSITIDIYYVKYQDGVSYEDLYNEQKYRPTVVRGYRLEPNDPDEDPSLNLPDGTGKRNVDLLVENLEPNTTYIIWVRAVRESMGLFSEPSDPVIVTTNPVDAYPPETPPVPHLIVNNVGDTFVDLVWDFKDKYRYYIKYGTVDDVNSAREIQVDLKGLNYFRVSGLNKDTLYYFWIRAEYVAPDGQSRSSVWSDSIPVKTLPDIPPDTPEGFGIKNSPDAITKDSITYEWLTEEGLEYILEIASKIDYSDAKEYKAGAVSEFRVDGLRSNTRYYARLYAYDPEKKLRSKPTQSIAVKTLRSSDDYDSDVDIDDLVTGDFVVKDSTVVKGVWTIRITGVNADRFIEHVANDRKLDYFLDVSKPPSKADRISIIISVKVFEALSRLKENLVVLIDGSRLVIRPGTITRELAGRRDDFDYEFAISYKGTSGTSRVKNLSFKTKVTGIELNLLEGANSMPVESFDAPLKVLVPYSGRNWYVEGKTSGAVYDSDASKWVRLSTSNSYDGISGDGFISFEMARPGDMAVVLQGSNYFDDIYGHKYEDSINNVASVHELKSVSGRKFNPDGNAAIADAVKFMLDVLDYSYGNDYMQVAAKAGIVLKEDAGNGSSYCTREKAVYMVARVYEIKSGSPAKPSGGYGDVYRDMSSVSASFLEKVRFAAENGIVVREGGGTLEPKAHVTRGELMAMLERMLALLGELD